jgi:hypothetical protein
VEFGHMAGKHTVGKHMENEGENEMVHIWENEGENEMERIWDTVSEKDLFVYFLWMFFFW